MAGFVKRILHGSIPYGNPLKCRLLQAPEAVPRIRSRRNGFFFSGTGHLQFFKNRRDLDQRLDSMQSRLWKLIPDLGRFENRTLKFPAVHKTHRLQDAATPCSRKKTGTGSAPIRDVYFGRKCE
jgi:hypothetical protein